jgi:hypothetical protein
LYFSVLTGEVRSVARGVWAVRWIRVSLLQVVEDLVVRRAKDAVGGGFEGSQNDGPKDVVDGERAHVLKISADIADFAKVGVNSVLGVTIPGHETSDLSGNEDSLHTLVLEGERGQKSFPYHRTKLGRAVFVKNGVGVRKIGPQRHKTAVYVDFKKIAFMFVHRHP